MTPLWIDDISILYEKKSLFEIVPMKNFDLNRKLNSLFRLSIFYSLIVYLLNKLFANNSNIRVVSYSMPATIGNYDYHCS